MRALIARLLRWDCMFKDWDDDDCLYWHRVYGCSPCRHCSWRFSL